MKISRLARVLSIVLLFCASVVPVMMAAPGAFTVVIDPGHGGADPGTITRVAKEKDINLSIALGLGAQIVKNCPEVNVVYTRSTDIFIPLQERADIANKHKADLFISLHVNSSTSSRANGFETFILGTDKMEANLDVAMRENSVILLEENYQVTYQGFDPNSIDSYIMFELMQDEYRDKSLKFASMVQKQVVNNLQRNDRGVKQAAFLVLLKSACPSVLIETGFISNAEEEKYLTGDGKNQVTQAIFDAFYAYYKGNAGGVVTTTKPAEQPAVTSKPQQTSTNAIFYSVQIFSVSKELPKGDARFQGLECRMRVGEDGAYKYTYGECETYEEAKNLVQSLKQKFPGCFVVRLAR